MSIQDTDRKDMLRMLPGVDRVFEAVRDREPLRNAPRSVVMNAARKVIENLRAAILENAETALPEEDLREERIYDRVIAQVVADLSPNLKTLVNATGVVIHTNLGRSPLAQCAVEHIATVASRYSNLEFNLAAGKRGVRYAAVEDILCEISGAEAAMVVNNNAAAVLLCLDTFARGKNVIVSRGELVEIGGSFRIPEVMVKSGAILREVGTTNRTHLRDYENAIDGETGILLKVHTSNFNIQGFTAAVGLKEMVDLGRRNRIPVMEDLGSGTFIDFTRYGLTGEPTIQESVTAGVDMVTFSGDKLLGGPQAGIVLGRRSIIDAIRINPLTRAMRIDKLTLAGLESTLRLYREESTAVCAIPTLRMLTAPLEEIRQRAECLYRMLVAIDAPGLQVEQLTKSSRVGGGALPTLEIPSCCIGVRVMGVPVNDLEKTMRLRSTPIIGRIEDDRFIIDLRTVLDDELRIVADAVSDILAQTDRMNNRGL